MYINFETKTMIHSLQAKMRETTILLMEHIPEGLALMVESYILPVRGRDAAWTDHWELASQITDGNDLNHALIGAARNNNIPMISMLISHGADSKSACLSGAAQKGHIELAEMVINNTLIPGSPVPDVLVATCTAGTVPMLEWLLRHMQDQYLTYVYTYAFNNALIKKKSDIVMYCITHGEFDPGDGLYYACIGGDPGLILLMRRCNAEFDTGSINEGLCGACHANNIRVANQMITLGANNWDTCLAECVENIYAYKFVLAELMISHGAADICALSNWNIGLPDDPAVFEWIRSTMIVPCSVCNLAASEHGFMNPECVM